MPESTEEPVLAAEGATRSITIPLLVLGLFGAIYLGCIFMDAGRASRRR